MINQAHLSAIASAYDVNDGPSYHPSEEGGLLLELDMLDAGSFTVTPGTPDTVTSITNKVSAAALTQAAANAPIYLPTGLNGHPAMRGEIARVTRIIGNEAAILAALSTELPYTLIYVAHIQIADTAVAHFCAANGGSNSSNVLRIGQATTGSGRYTAALIDDANGATINAESAATVDTTAPHVIVWRCNGTTISGSRDGVSFDPSAAAFDPVSTVTPTRYGLFARLRTTIDLPSDAIIGAMYLFDNALSDAAIQNVVDYLTTRWLA